MKLIVLLTVVGIMLAGCEAKRKGHKSRTEEENKMECGHSLSHMLGLSRHHDILHIDSVLRCYQDNGYDYCNNNMDKEDKERLLDTCKEPVQNFINDITSIVGHKPHWVDEIFARERDARNTRTRTGTGTATGSVPSFCTNFALDLISFLDNLAFFLARAIRDSASCFSRSRGVANTVACLVDAVSSFIIPFLRDNFFRCLLAFLGLTF